MKRPLLLLISILVAALQAFAKVTVLTSKNGKVLASADQAPAIGQELELVSETGARVRLRVERVKDGKFIGLVLEGEPAAGLVLELVATPPPEAAKKAKKTPFEEVLQNVFWGAGMFSGSNSITGRLATGTEVAMSGSTAGVEAVADWNFAPFARVRAHLSKAPLAGTGSIASASCGGSKTCEVNLDYLSARLEAQVVRRTVDWFGFFAGGGLGLHVPLAKSSNFLDTTALSLTQTFEVTAGTEWRWSDDLYADLGVQALFFPSSDAVQVRQTGIVIQILRRW